MISTLPTPAETDIASCGDKTFDQQSLGPKRIRQNFCYRQSPQRVRRSAR